jgi:hypothetical protein
MIGATGAGMSEPVDPLTVKNELISRLLHPGKGLIVYGAPAGCREALTRTVRTEPMILMVRFE